ncbi:ATP-binding cassette domain-containing protein [Amycolatopsis sacchari]|uniref:ATP-binding cassette domain-containing protein n=1 Tax=Amycolatopsis sacchari TaxID=115433 RepID=UPI003D719743
MNACSAPLLDVADLRVRFAMPGRHGRTLSAVDGVSLRISRGETLGLVGESGSGKSTLGNAILGRVPVAEGHIVLDGEDITRLSGKRRRPLARRLQVVIQDPYNSLNPARTVGQTLAEPLRFGERLTRAEILAKVADTLRRVGLAPDAAHRYPTQFSGGQRQRIAIARALVLEPELVVCDEPTSALDLSVQAQILNLLLDLQHQFGLSYLFITHDIDVVRHVSHRVAVMYRGRIVEQGDVEQVTSHPSDPYTRALLTAAPVPDPREQARRRVARAAS